MSLLGGLINIARKALIDIAILCRAHIIKKVMREYQSCLAGKFGSLLALMLLFFDTFP